MPTAQRSDISQLDIWFEITNPHNFYNISKNATHSFEISDE